MTTLPILPPQLLIPADLAAYAAAVCWEREQTYLLIHGPAEMPLPATTLYPPAQDDLVSPFRPDQVRRIRHQLSGLHDMAFWLYLEQWLTEPDVEAIQVTIEVEPYETGFHVMMGVRSVGQWWCPYTDEGHEDPERARVLASALSLEPDDLAMFLRYDHPEPFTSDNWLEVATEYLGPEWRSARDALSDASTI